MQTSIATLGVVAIIYIVMAIVTGVKSSGIKRRDRFTENETTASDVDGNGEAVNYGRKQSTWIASNSISIYRTEAETGENTSSKLAVTMDLKSFGPRHFRKDFRRRIENDHPVRRSARDAVNVEETIGYSPVSLHPAESSTKTNDVFTNYDAPSVSPAVSTSEINNLEDSGIHVESMSVQTFANAVDTIDRIETSNGTGVPAIELYDAEEDEGDGKKGRKPVNTEGTPLMSEKMMVEDVRAISFRVPSAKIEGTKVDPSSNELETERSERIADRSRSQASSQANAKSARAFYEIKPSVNTETDRVDLQESITRRNVGRFVMPSVASAVGKFGPYFEDGDGEKNVTARIGSTVLLDCKIGMLGDKMVTWLQHTKDSIRLLTVGRKAYSLDQRISLKFRYPSNWRLQIMYASLRDSGLYKCQVATHPPLVKKINVIVTAPLLTIVDDAGRMVAGERHLKAGSALRLKCEARDVLGGQNESVVWTRGDETLTEDVSENKTTDVPGNEGERMIVSTVFVEKATPRHAGNYSCSVPGRARTTVVVHVLNGELPAAVHDGNGASRAVLNLWLIHLTVSYVFSR